MSIPIIFVHKGNPFFLHSVLKQAKRTNPNSEIILLGDNTNCKYKFVKHYFIDDYFTSAEAFSKVYQHYSPNPYDYELFCFQRWFVIKDFVDRTWGGNAQFLYCDTDTLLYDDISFDINRFQSYDMTICKTGTPCFTYFNFGIIAKFTDFIYQRFSSPEGRSMINEYVAELKNKKRSYGISDMTAFSAYKNEHLNKVLEIDVPENGTSYCHNIGDKVDGYKMSGKLIDIHVKNGQPYGYFLKDNAWIRFKGVHFQGAAKMVMYKYLSFPWNLFFRLKYLYTKFKEKVFNGKE